MKKKCFPTVVLLSACLGSIGAVPAQDVVTEDVAEEAMEERSGFVVQGAEIEDFNGQYCEVKSEDGLPSKFVKSDDEDYVLLWNFESDEEAYWVFEHQGGGEFYILSLESTPPLSGYRYREARKTSVLTLAQTICPPEEEEGGEATTGGELVIE